MKHFYQRFPHFFNFQDVYREAVELAPEGGHLVEVGVYEGASLAFLAVEAFNSGKNLKITGVDAFRHRPGVFEETYRWIVDEGLSGVVSLALDLSWDAAALFDDASLDFVFFDAGHSYEDLSQDLKAYWPKLKPTGYFAGHDWSEIDFPGVEKACREFFPTVGFPVGPCSVSSWKMGR